VQLHLRAFARVLARGESSSWLPRLAAAAVAPLLLPGFLLYRWTRAARRLWRTRISLRSTDLMAAMALFQALGESSGYAL
jgi:hypothetical protein